MHEPEHKFSVSEIASRIHKRGHLHHNLDSRTRPEEGIATQKRLQQQRKGSYCTEVTVSERYCYKGLALKIQGRADGVLLTDEPHFLVEEIKTTRAAAHLAHEAQADEHWAQVKLYAAMLAQDNPHLQICCCQLTYVHPDSLQAISFEERLTRTALLDFLWTSVRALGETLALEQSRRACRDQEIDRLAFPFADYRPHQQAMARRVYKVLAEASSLLLEAPTGSGKSMGVLYPAVKSLAQTNTQRLLFLTSRHTGARAALDAAHKMSATGTALRTIHISAKATMCPVAGMPCGPQACPYARDYFDKIPAAVTQLLAHSVVDAAKITEVAEQHEVCPFELSLDAALQCDLVVGDYNYVFDPLVRLLRFADGSKNTLLVDEAHHLADRSRDMLSVSFSRDLIKPAMNEAEMAGLTPVVRRIKSMDRQLLNLRKQWGKQWRNDRDSKASATFMIDYPDKLPQAMQNFVEELAQTSVDLANLPEIRELSFACFRWSRLEQFYDADRYAIELTLTKRQIDVQLVCLDSSAYLAEVLDGHRANVRFSGTISPLPLYQLLHGQPAASADRVASPFSADQLKLMIVDNVPTYYQQRQRSLTQLVDLVSRIQRASPGNGLVALPSFAYLKQFIQAYPVQADQRLLVQHPGMSKEEQLALLAGFDNNVPTLGVVVLGGVFAESLDFTAVKLHSVVCVGVGLPPPSKMRDAMADCFQNQFGPTDEGTGQTMAYLQPAMNKVIQFAGRLIRRPEDRGVICLIDARFTRPEYQQFFPSIWQPIILRDHQVVNEVEKFWQHD